MKTMLFILTLITFTYAHSELTTSDTDDLSYTDTEFNYDDSDENSDTPFANEEVTITPLFDVAGSGGGKPNCSCSGEASFYADKFNGRSTANGETFSNSAMTAAHRCLPFGTKVRVCMQRSPGNCITVRINDRGPYAGNRIIDLSKAAAGKLGFINSGHAKVTLSACK